MRLLADKGFCVSRGLKRFIAQVGCHVLRLSCQLLLEDAGVAVSTRPHVSTAGPCACWHGDKRISCVKCSPAVR